MASVVDVRRCLELQAPARLPVFCMCDEFDAAYCGIPAEEYGRSADVIVECKLQTLDSFGWD